MKMRVCLVCVLAACLLVAFASPAQAAHFFEGSNIMAFPKAQTSWVGQLTSPNDASSRGVAHAVETACHDGIGLSIVAPQVLPFADRGLITVVTDDGKTFVMPVRDYQLGMGFLFVLDHWPVASSVTGEDWPVRPEWFWMNPEAAPDGDVMPLYVEWTRAPLNYDLTVSEFLAALDGEGSVTLALYAGDDLLAEGVIK